MRELQRIDRILNLVQQIWQRYPDLRFFQLMSVLEHEYSKRHHNAGRREQLERDQRGVEMPHPIVDLFYLEDGSVEEFLKQYLSECK